MIEKNTEALREMAEKAAGGGAEGRQESKADKAASADVQKVGDYYASGMDEAAIDAAKAKPLEEEFKRIDAMKDRKDVLKEIAHLHIMGVGAFFVFTSGQDDKNSTMVIGQAYQGGLGHAGPRLLHEGRRRLEKDARPICRARDENADARGRARGRQAAEHAKKIMALETSLAKPARTRVELRDPQKNYNKMKQAELQELTPDWKWADYFKEIKLTNPGDINVGQPDFFKAANEVFQDDLDRRLEDLSALASHSRRGRRALERFRE